MMLINKEKAKAIVKYLDAQKLKMIHPDFKIENWKYVKAMAEGYEIMFVHEVTPVKKSCCFFNSPCNYYSIKQKTINSIVPETEAPNDGDMYFALEMDGRNGYKEYEWVGDTADLHMLNSGVVYLDEEKIKEVVSGLQT